MNGTDYSTDGRVAAIASGGERCYNPQTPISFTLSEVAMSRRRTYVLAGPLFAALALVFVTLCIASASTYAQVAATPPAADAASAEITATVEITVTPGTPTPTATPTLTPTATPTLTDLQSRLLLANTYLQGRDYERAAQLFRGVAEEDRGNTEALAGLAAALEGSANEMATLMAPLPEPTPLPQPTAVTPTLADAAATKVREYAGSAIAVLLLIVALYLAAHLLRWLLAWLRELWYLRILPLLGRPAAEPGYLIGQFTNTLGGAGENAAALVPFALTDKLLAWNQLVQAKEAPVAAEPALDLGSMAWLKLFWRWILPAPRGYRVTGVLLPGARGAYRLAVQRIDLAHNNVERSATFELAGASPDVVYRDLAGEAAKWLVKPQDMEAAAASMRGLRSTRLQGQPDVLSPSEIFDQALTLLLPVRQQVGQGAIDFGDARERLRQATELLADLPAESSLRADLEAVIADLHRQVPGS